VSGVGRTRSISIASALLSHTGPSRRAAHSPAPRRLRPHAPTGRARRITFSTSAKGCSRPSPCHELPAAFSITTTPARSKRRASRRHAAPADARSLTTLVPADPRSVLVVGCGAARDRGGSEHRSCGRAVDIVEIEPLVPRVVSTHFSAQNHEWSAIPRSVSRSTMRAITCLRLERSSTRSRRSSRPVGQERGDSLYEGVLGKRPSASESQRVVRSSCACTRAARRR